jgi:hypothetical protein
MPLRHLAFVLEDFALQTPAQQLLDRFLLGYRRAGEFHKLDGLRITAARAGDLQPPPAASDLLRARASEAALQITDLPTAVREADAIVVMPRADSAAPVAAMLTATLTHAQRGAACFVFGALAPDLAAARTFVTLAAARQITLAAGTFLPVTWRLPQVDLPANAPVDEALIVVQGASPIAELHALDGLLPVLARRAGGERGVRRVKHLAGADLWRAGERREWSWGLLSAALSRSDSPQGDTLVDGRTQDLVGLGQVPKLATNPRGWLLEHTDGVRTALLALDGVVADFNFAVRLGDGSEVSAQLFRAPVPAQEHYSPLAAVIEDFFRTGEPPWPASRALLTAGLLGACRQAAARPGVWLGTPELLGGSRLLGR